MIRPFKTDILQLMRSFIMGFYQMNHGVNAEHIYLPVDMFDLLIDRIDDDFRGAGVPDEVLDTAENYTFLGVHIHSHNSYDIIVTRDPLP